MWRGILTGDTCSGHPVFNLSLSLSQSTTASCLSIKLTNTTPPAQRHLLASLSLAFYLTQKLSLPHHRGRQPLNFPVLPSPRALSRRFYTGLPSLWVIIRWILGKKWYVEALANIIYLGHEYQLLDRRPSFSLLLFTRTQVNSCLPKLKSAARRIMLIWWSMQWLSDRKSISRNRKSTSRTISLLSNINYCVCAMH